MIKFLIISLGLSAFAAHEPSSEKESLNPYGIFRIFKTIDKKHKFVASTFFRKDNDRNTYGADFSLRRKVSKHVQYGIEGDVKSGIRHDDDWIIPNGTWEWEDESSTEFGTTLFLKFKKGLYFLPGTNWIGEINLKTHNNWTETLLTLKPEATLTYVHFANGKPLYNIYTKLQYYIPLNYSTEDIYQKWLYLGTMLHWKKNLRPFVFIALKDETWTRSEAFEQGHLNADYKATSELSYIGIGLNYYLD
jgi:hypothetical protein